MELFIFFILWLICGAWAGSITEKKGRGAGIGWALGLILGIFGPLIAACMSADPEADKRAKLATGNYQVCLACRSTIDRQASVCPQCRTAVAR